MNYFQFKRFHEGQATLLKSLNSSPKELDINTFGRGPYGIFLSMQPVSTRSKQKKNKKNRRISTTGPFWVGH